MALSISPSGVKAIQQFEALRLEAYQDAVGVWTIGYGHIGSEHAQPGKKITKAKALQLLQKDLEESEAIVNKHVKAELTQPMFDALVSLVFNIGPGNFRKSTLLRKLNEEDYLGAAEEFPKWRKAGGQVLNGLVKRRAAERALFLSGVEVLTTDDENEGNIEPDAPKRSVSLSKPEVSVPATLVGTGALSELTTQLEPLAAYSETIRYIWIALGVIAVLLTVWYTRKED